MGRTPYIVAWGASVTGAEGGSRMAAISVPAAVQAAVADLYGGAFRWPFETFKEDALRRIRAVLPFTSAVWGSGVHSTDTMLSLSLLDQPVEMLLAYASEWERYDTCRIAAVAEPGRAFRDQDVQSLEEYRASAVHREFCRPWGMEYTMTVVQVGAVTDLAEIVCLFRADVAQPFADDERALLEHLAPHLAAAWRQAQIAHHYRAAVEGGALGVREPERWAVVDGEGFVYAAGDEFCLALRACDPNWKGPSLPAFLRPLASGARQAVIVGGTEFRARRAPERMLLAAVPARGAFGLTAAELRAARLYADGLKQREIAARLGVSASTVRNQLSSAYDKLRVHSKLELLRALSRAPA
jgi:DNA-binding CsgD family transcriptional regulator